MGDDFSAIWAGLQDRMAASDVYTRDPVRWLRKNGEEVWSEQRNIME